MKYISIIAISLLLSLGVNAQVTNDSTSSNVVNLSTQIKVIVEDLSKQFAAGKIDEEEFETLLEQQISKLLIQDAGLGKPGSSNFQRDTTIVKVGNTTITIVDGKVDDVVIGQEDKNKSNSDVESSRKYRKYDRVETQSFLIDLGFNSYIDEGNLGVSNGNPLMELNNARSIEFALQFFNSNINIVRDNFAFVTGLGITSNNYRFRKDVSLLPDKDTVTIILDSVDFRTNKLNPLFLTAPALLRFDLNSKTDKRFFLEAGLEFGYMIGSKTKQVSKERGKVKFRDDFNLEPFRYSALARVGYGNIAFYGRYALSDLFREDQGPTLTPVSFGIALGFGR